MLNNIISRHTYNLMRSVSLIALIATGLGGCAGREVAFGKSVRTLNGDMQPNNINEIAVGMKSSLFAINERGMYMPGCLLEDGKASCVDGTSQPGRNKNALDAKMDPTNPIDQAPYIDMFVNNIHAALSKDKDTNKKEKRIVIFIHGGLNTKGNWIDKIKFIDEINKYNESSPDVELFPLFILWESGPFETYSDQLFNYDQGKTDTWYKRFASPLYLLGDVISGIARSPASIAKASQTFTSASFSNDTFSQQCRKDIAADNNETKSALLYCAGGDSVNSFESTWETVKRRTLITIPLEVIGTPFVVGAGQQAWDNMLLRTKTLLHVPCEFDPNIDGSRCNSNAKNAKNAKGLGALYLLLNKLDEKFEWTKVKKLRDDISYFKTSLRNREAELKTAGTDIDKTNKRIEHIKAELVESEDFLKKTSAYSNTTITLIGHNMSSIVANQMLNEFPVLPYSEVVYMAGADTVQNTRYSLIPAMKQNPDLKFYNLSLHPWAETSEISASGFAPSGSLLEWIDNIYTTPKNSMDKTIGKWENVADTIHTFPSSLHERMVFKRFGLSETDPIEHGDFSSKCKFWRPEFWATDSVKEGLRHPFGKIKEMDKKDICNPDKKEETAQK